MKAHLGVDSRSKLIHAAAATPANVADSKMLPELLHGRETRVWGDQAYRGQRAVIRQKAPRGAGFHQPPLSPSRPRGRGRASQEPHQIEGAR
jgi:IS5 family transposase